MKVGFIGLGNIGMPMAKTLLAAGFDLTVFNRSRGKVEEMIALGAKAASSTAESFESNNTLLAWLPAPPTGDGPQLLHQPATTPTNSRRIATPQG